MDRGSVEVSKCEKALNGTALLAAELVVLAVEDDVGVNALTGGESVLAAGVKRAVVVSALDPAVVEPIEEVEEAAAPLAPADELL